jgi:hypothetical protein
VTVDSEIQSAVDGARDGDVICVKPGNYEESVTIGKKDLTLRSANPGNAIINAKGESQSTISIAADGVTVKGLTVKNPGGLLGIKVQPGYDAASIKNNVVKDIGPTGRLGVTGIIVGTGDHDDIEITGNRIQSLDQETTDDSEFPTVNGILFDATDKNKGNKNKGTITNVAVNNNTIRDVESDIAPLGILIQQKTDGVEINDNVIKDLVAADETDSDPSDGVDFGFTFAQGINITSPSTADTEVRGNVIKEITSTELILPEAVKIDGDGGGVKFRQNQFLVAVGLNNRNGTGDDGSRDPSNDPLVDAKNNWWWSPKGPEEADFNQAADDDERAAVVGNVTTDPFLTKPPVGGGNGPGGLPQGTPGNGPGGNPGGGPGN